MESERIKTHIIDLLLDPNNYRFIDRQDYKAVPNEDVADTRIQQRTFNFIAGKNNENISDLIISFTTNGFLDIDQIQVKKVDDKYLVLEGNRRITTLKYLYDEFEKGNDVGKLVENDFTNVNLVEIKDEDPVQHLITMGLHHISGKKRWNAVNEAQLIYDLIYTHNKQENEVCDSLGISKFALRRSIRTLSLIKQYKESDYGDQFLPPMYTIFETVVGSPIMKEWIGWDDEEYRATKDANVERFFSWISRSDETELTDNGEEVKLKKDPIITQYRQIKEVASFITDFKAINRMEESRSIAEAYSFSDAIGEAKLRNAIENIKGSAKVAFNFNEFMTPSDYEDINNVKLKLDALIPMQQALILINEKKAAKYFEAVKNQFSTFHIEQYRKLKNIDVSNIKRINIFAGGNNMGKTSMLEAFYLLSQLNDINTYFDLEKYRGKFSNEFHSVWMDKNFISDIDLSGKFNDSSTSLKIKTEATEEDIERTGYLSTIISEAIVADSIFTSSMHLYSNKEPELRFTSSRILCKSAFTSPYRYNSSLLQTAHTSAVKEGYFEEVKNFIRKKLDPSIKNIELVSEAGENRFMVSTENAEKPIDLTKYGEGLQRVFEIALLLGYCRDGILCIDEIDSALHKSLLIDFTQFIQEMAEKFNVQIFLSTHSKECIDAFVENEYPDDDLTAFALTEENGKILCKYLEGNKLKQLVESINLDIR
ncbi:AAA family ATPase [Pedobacter sp. FW305-3-2-15-E-R2A2]|uniref:AAA family ATPase n=1 Tax=Pedobacter sp. FW305-3-2-15-E-R2A2 TaxID=3140251 RepID=UPI003140985B